MKMFGDISVSSKEMQEAIAANADGQENYVGLNDAMLDFGDANSFINESEANKEFTMKFVNGTAATQKIQFNKVLEDVANHTVIKEGNIVTVSGSPDTYLTGNGDPASIDKLLKLIEFSPLRVRAIKIDVNSEAQLSEPIKMYESNVFRTDSHRQIVPSNYQDQTTNNTKTVTVDVNYVLSMRHTLLYAIRPSAEVTMTFFFGASLDLDTALNQKYRKCVNTAAAFIGRQ